MKIKEFLKTIDSTSVFISIILVLIATYIFLGSLFKPIPIGDSHHVTKATVVNLPYYPVSVDKDIDWYSEELNHFPTGRFTLILVTDKQLEFLQKRGLPLFNLGGEIDMTYPKYFGPIRFNEGFMVFYKDAVEYSFLKETDPKPQLFWAAIRTDEEAYHK